ncbi:hypothetical protein LIER_13884 [Lithospermum erythrorhizon]|uniref:Scarecrow-like protein 6 n=1 Tax=Lithospermum erythrorhizon TaxID=34254 RepID=A0AAV3PXH5_LITER
MGAESALQPMPPSLELAGGAGSGPGGGDKCAMEEWESVLSGSVSASPSQQHYWMMGDVEDPTINTFHKVLQSGGVSDFEFNTLFGNVDQGFGTDPSGIISSTSASVLPTINPPIFPSGNFKIGSQQHPMFPSLTNNVGPIGLGDQMQPPSFLPQLMMNQHQSHQLQNPSFFFPLPFASQDQNVGIPPQAKRHNPGVVGGFEKELLIGRQQQQQQEVSQGFPQQLQMRPLIGVKTKMVGDEMGQIFQQQQQHQHQQAIIDHLFKAAELIQAGNLVLAQEILARLNHQLSPIGKPFHRASFYFNEALQLLLHNNSGVNPSSIHSSPFSLVFKIGAYKSLSEISPILQFANFTCNQAILEEVEGFERIHVIDFDIGYGGQWASFMQELSLRSGGAPYLKITAFASPSTHDQLELELVRENLIQFASEINMLLEFDIMNIDSLNSGSWPVQNHVSENEAVAVNLPVTSFSNSHLPLPLVLRFVKQLSPKVVVSVDRGCDRTDLPFPNHVIHALQSYCNLFESLDAVNVNLEASQKIERFLAQPGIEKIVMGRYRFPEKTQHWRSLFLSSGFSPLTFSNVTETQAECVVKRTPVRGFHVEKRQSSLVLCWQQKELISATAWRS